MAPRPERSLEILSPVKNTFDEKGFLQDHEGDRHSALEADRSQAGQDIVGSLSSLRKCRKPCAVGEDSTDMAVGGLFARLRRDASVESVDPPFGRGVKTTRTTRFIGRPRGAP
jgi:hypothetical protein